MPFGRQRKEFPSQLWTQCPSCNEMLFNKQLARNHNVCSNCGHHFRLGARERIELLVDKGSFTEHDTDLASGDPLGFSDQKPYLQRIEQSQVKTGEKDAAICGSAKIDENAIELAVMDFDFMGGSMGSVVGEKLTRAAERALANRTPLLIVSASGGARIHAAVLHANIPDRARLLGEWVQQRYHCVEYWVDEAGPGLASHAGPGTVALGWYPEEHGGS